MDRPSEEQIRERSHQLWEAAGKPEGRHEEEFWQQAERELRSLKTSTVPIDRNECYEAANSIEVRMVIAGIWGATPRMGTPLSFTSPTPSGKSWQRHPPGPAG